MTSASAVQPWMACKSKFGRCLHGWVGRCRLQQITDYALQMDISSTMQISVPSAKNKHQLASCKFCDKHPMQKLILAYQKCIKYRVTWGMQHQHEPIMTAMSWSGLPYMKQFWNVCGALTWLHASQACRISFARLQASVHHCLYVCKSLCAGLYYIVHHCTFCICRVIYHL